MTTAELLRQRLELVYLWYQGMVNADTGMLEYLYLPETDTFVREQSPIRDIAAVWDAALVGAFLKRDDLRVMIERSVAHYLGYLARRDGYLILEPRLLREASSIAHSAFMIQALLRAPPPQRSSEILALAEGIRRQQRPDGSYKVYFHDLPDSGEELYAGEAMLALLETFSELHESQCLQSAERAFVHYDAHYFQRGLVADDVLVFFANWQSQACRLLFENARTPTLAREIAEYLYRMQDRIIEHGFFDAVERHPAQQASVAVACALEGLNDAYTVARASHDARVEPYRQQICAGLTYLLALQCTGNADDRARGGFGLERDDRTQRIDVTGHAASAFMKSIENDIACAQAA